MNDCLLEQKAKRRDVNLYQFYCTALVSQSTKLSRVKDLPSVLYRYTIKYIPDEFYDSETGVEVQIPRSSIQRVIATLIEVIFFGIYGEIINKMINNHG